MGYRIRLFLLLCLCGVFLNGNALSQTIQPDKKEYDIKDTIVITFSYGAERDYSAFVFIRPIKDGGSQYSSNAYDQATGRKVIDDHRFPPGEYEVVLEYPSHDAPRVIARNTFTVASKDVPETNAPIRRHRATPKIPGQVTVSLPQRVLEAKHTDHVFTQNPGMPNIIHVKSSNPSVARAYVYRVKSVQIIAVAPGKTTVEFLDRVEGKLYQVSVWVTAANQSGGGGQGYNPGLTQLPQIVMLVKHTENAHTPNDAAAQISGVKSSNPSVATARTDPPKGIQIYSVALGDTWIEFADNTTGTTYQVHVWVRDKIN